MRCSILSFVRRSLPPALVAALLIALAFAAQTARADEPALKQGENLFDFDKDPLKPRTAPRPKPSTQPAQLGAAEVRVVSTHLDYVPLGPSTEHGNAPEQFDTSNSQDKFLIVRLQIRNTSPDKPLTYNTFALPFGPRQTYASLAVGNKMLTLVNFGDQEPVGLTRKAQVPPGKSVNDVLVFLPIPDLDAKTMEIPLKLSLPPQQLGLDPAAKPTKIDLDFANIQKRP